MLGISKRYLQFAAWSSGLLASCGTMNINCNPQCQDEEDTPKIWSLGRPLHLYDNTTLSLHDGATIQWFQQNHVPSDNEVFIVTYQKCGTTLTQQICHEIMHIIYRRTGDEAHSYYSDTDGFYNHSEWIEVKYKEDEDGYAQFIEDTKDTIRFWKTHCNVLCFNQ